MSGDWRHMVPQEHAVHSPEHRVQAASANARLRVTELHLRELRTHFFNHASRRAIERLGTKLDGVLRNNQILPGGNIRDTCAYSIIASEWPVVKTNLLWKLSPP
jgi:hypothetical protein